MNIFSSLKLIGDEYEGFYSCGLTMFNSETMKRFTDVVDTLDQTVAKSQDGLMLTVKHTKDESNEVTTIQTILENKGQNQVNLEMIDSFAVSGITGDKIHRFLSFWSAEGRHRVDDIRQMNMEHSWNGMAYRVEKFGNVGSMPVRKYFPFLAIEDSATGKFTAFQLYSPSSWQMEIIVREDDTITVTGGIADRDFGHFTKNLKSGESFETPKAVMATGNSLYEVCDRLVKAQNPDISSIDDHMGITFNEYCTTWGDPNEENMKKIADALEGEGIQYLVMDSGWFIDGKGYWWDETGNWDYSPSRFPKGLKDLADYIKAKGMVPGIWYEFENVSKGCPLYLNSDVLVKKDGVPLSVGGRRFLDMENEWVKTHLKNKVIDSLKEAGFGYIKVDYNDTMGMGCDGPDGMGENLRRKVAATQDFFREMKKEIPDLIIENCSSGGHRLEPSFMELASMASFSDAHEILELPIIAASLQLQIKPEQSQIWAVLRKDDSESRMYYSLCGTLFGRMGLSGDIFDISERQWKILREGMRFYKEAAHIIKSGMTILIHNSSRSNNNPQGGQLAVRKLDNEYLVVYHRFADSVDVRTFLEEANLQSAAAGENDKVISLIKSSESMNVKAVSENKNAVMRDFGEAVCDFSAQAWILKI